MEQECEFQRQNIFLCKIFKIERNLLSGEEGNYDNEEIN
jgi:hypothetical protein